MCKYRKIYLVILLTILIFVSDVLGKKSKIPKRPKENQDISTPQPDLATYSSFGYNNVEAPMYDGFVPSSPDYVNHINSFQESSTRLYAPAFPTAYDSTGADGYSGNYDTQHEDHNLNQEGQVDSNPLQYQQSSLNYINTASLSDSNNVHQPNAFYRSQDITDSTAPIYGTKINSRNKNTNNNNVYSNDTRSIYQSLQLNPYYDDKKIQNFQVNNDNNQAISAFDTINKNYDNINNYAPTFPPTSESFQFKSNSSQVSFPKFVDFTKHKVPYATSVDNQYISSSLKASDVFNSREPMWKDKEVFPSSYKYGHESHDTKSTNKEFSNGGNENSIKPESQNYQNSYYNQLDYLDSKHKENYEKPYNYKDNVKNTFTGYDRETYNMKTPFTDLPDIRNNEKYNNPLTHQDHFFNGLDYNQWKKDFNEFKHHNLKNYSHLNSKKQGAKNPYDNTETASSNIIDLTSYQFPNFDHTFNKDNNYKQYFTPENMGDFGNVHDWKYIENTESTHLSDSYKPFKEIHSLTTTPKTTSYWGNNFKTYSGTNSLRNNKNKITYFHNEEDNDEIVHIPKKQYNHKPHNYLKYQENKPDDWLLNIKHNTKHGKGKPIDEWNKEVSTRFKSEEDLLGLRTHDTSHPSYLPMFKFADEEDDYQNYASKYDYRNAIEKWKQNYLKSKYFRNWENRDHYSMSSESKPTHVPIPKPYPVST